MKRTPYLLSISFILIFHLFPKLAFAQDSLFIIPKPLVQKAGHGIYTYPDLEEVSASKAFLAAADLLHEHPYIHFKTAKLL